MQMKRRKSLRLGTVTELFHKKAGTCTLVTKLNKRKFLFLRRAQNSVERSSLSNLKGPSKLKKETSTPS